MPWGSAYRSFVTDQAGRILQKTQGGQNEYYFYADDKPLGATGAAGAADFDFNYTPVSDNYPAATPSSYAVNSGDTLRSIAQTVYGDGALWYLIADANGISSDAQLKIGMTLSVPNKITNLHNSYQSFKPYAPAEIIGDTTPTLPDPPPPPQDDDGCGGVGMIVVIAVVIAATVLTAGAAAVLAAGEVELASLSVGLVADIGGAVLAGGAGLAGVGMAAAAAAVGSLAGQGAAIAMGMQDDISWDQVGMAAIGGGVTAGMGAYFGQTAGSYPALAARAAGGNAITQGLAMAAGYQDQFNWRSVAVSAVSAPLAAQTSSAIAGSQFGKDAGYWGTRLTTNLVNGTGIQLVRKALYNGGKIDYEQITADAFGNTLGNSVSEQGARGASQQEAKVELEPGSEYMNAAAGGSASRNSNRSAVAAGGDAVEGGAESFQEALARRRSELLVYQEQQVGAAGEWGQGIAGGALGAGETVAAAAWGTLRFASDTVNASLNTLSGGLLSRYLPSVFQGSVNRYSEIGNALMHPLDTASGAVDAVKAKLDAFQAAKAAGDTFTASRIGMQLFTDGALALAPLVGSVGRLGEVGEVSRIGEVSQVASKIPFGFRQASEFESFGSSLYGGLESAGFKNVEAAFQGSSVTGRAFRPPHQPFDVGRISDFDIALSSPELFEKAQAVGIGLRSQGTRTGPLSLETTPELLERMGLTQLSTQLAQQAGRPVNFMIYRSIDDAIARNPSIVVPRPR
jgi:hypothetical protein